jgi:hypothetical protein
MTNDDISREISQKLSHPQLHKNLPSPATPSQARAVAAHRVAVTPRIKQHAASLVPFEGNASLKQQFNKSSSSSAKKTSLAPPAVNSLFPHSSHSRHKAAANKASSQVAAVVQNVPVLNLSEMQVSKTHNV